MMIDTRNLSYSHPGSAYGIRLPDLNVPEGERLAVIGPSGCGKTTFLNLLSALIRPTGGEICVAGMDLANLSRRASRNWRARSIGYISRIVTHEGYAYTPLGWYGVHRTATGL